MNKEITKQKKKETKIFDYLNKKLRQKKCGNNHKNI